MKKKSKSKIDNKNEMPTQEELFAIAPSMVYLSGPITGVKDYKKNFKRAKELVAGTSLHYYDHIFDPSLSFNGNEDLRWDTYMRYDIMQLCKCHSIVLLPDWETSKGAQIEYMVACDLGLNIYEINEDYTHIAPYVEEAEVTKEEPQSPCLIAHSLVNGPRGEAYGHPYDDYARTARLFFDMTGKHLTVTEAVKFMICVKLSREANKHGRDNLIDVVGYVECLAKVIDRQKEIDKSYDCWQRQRTSTNEACGTIEIE